MLEGMLMVARSGRKWLAKNIFARSFRTLLGSTRLAARYFVHALRMLAREGQAYLHRVNKKN